MGQNSCQPEGLQPESALAALLVLAIERLLPSPGALPSPILAATHTCFTMLGTLVIAFPLPHRDAGHFDPGAINGFEGRDVERFPVGVTESHVGAVPWNLQAAEQPPVGRDHVHAAGPRAINVTLDVDLHPVGDAVFGAGHLVKNAAGPDAAGGVHVE